LMCIHRSHLCHIGGADQRSFFPSAPKFPATPDTRERRGTGQRPLTEDGHPGRLGRRASSLPETHPHRQPAPPAFPPPPFSSPTRPNPTEKAGKAGEAVAHVQAAASRRGCHRRRKDAPRQGERAGWFVKTASRVLTSSPTPYRALSTSLTPDHLAPEKIWAHGGNPTPFAGKHKHIFDNSCVS
jgi:hypothetical protein